MKHQHSTHSVARTTTSPRTLLVKYFILLAAIITVELVTPHIAGL